jgi:hypothetical protein
VVCVLDPEGLLRVLHSLFRIPRNERQGRKIKEVITGRHNFIQRKKEILFEERINR